MAIAFSEKVVPRSGPPGNCVTIGVTVPQGATITAVRGFMKNEPWGGITGKQDTDDMGTTDYFPCGLGVGECSIGWSRADAYLTAVNGDGTTTISAGFWNWVQRNDRTGKLEVEYSV